MGGQIGRAARERPWPLVVVAVATLTIAGAALMAARDATTVVSTAQALASGSAVVAAWWWCAPTGRSRSMVLLLAGSALWWCGDLAWLVVDVVGGGSWTDPSRVVYLLACLCLTASQVPSGNVFREATTRAVLDGLLVGLVVAFVVWSAVPDFPDDPFGYLTFINCAANGLLVSFTLLNLGQGPASQRVFHWALFCSALLITAQHGLHTTLSSTSGWAGGVLDLGWCAASILRMVAIVSVLERHHGTPAGRPEPRPPGFWERIIPLAAMAVGVTNALLVTSYTTGTVVVGVLLVACLVIRQLAADKEQRSLRARLSSAATELQRRADRDVLTGLQNRGPLIRAIGSALDRPADRSEVGLLFLDVDHFKNINDRFGHSVGDLVLVGISRALADAAGPQDIVARLGGDEFIVLRPQVTGDPNEWAEAVRARLEVRSRWRAVTSG